MIFQQTRSQLLRLNPFLKGMKVRVAELVLPKFSPVPSPKMSDKYVHVDTGRFIEAMAEEGFVPVEFQRDSARQRDPGFVRHMVKFEQPSAKDVRSDVRPRIIFLNSHNGTTRATVGAGLIRWACFNGMIVGSRVESLKTKHTGDAARDLIERARQLARNTAPLFEQIERWEKTELTEAKALEFAARAATIRWGEDKAKGYNPIHLLHTHRPEDEGMDAWKVLNRIQENATKGGFPGVAANGRNISARRITGIGLDTSFNVALWDLAEAITQ